jgi:hypothetical protein
MIAMTTKSSMSVNPLKADLRGFRVVISISPSIWPRKVGMKTKTFRLTLEATISLTETTDEVFALLPQAGAGLYPSLNSGRFDQGPIYN